MVARTLAGVLLAALVLATSAMTPPSLIEEQDGELTPKQLEALTLPPVPEFLEQGEVSSPPAPASLVLFFCLPVQLILFIACGFVSCSISLT